MAEQEPEKKTGKKTKLIDPQNNKVKFIPPGEFRPFTKDQQLNRKPAKSPKGGRR